MEYGVFDHLDRNDLPLNEFYEARLKLIEAYERAGFYAYHVAEHHSTPIGMAPSLSGPRHCALGRWFMLCHCTIH